MLRSAVLDFQGFRSCSGSFIVKELTIVDTAHGTAWHWIFRSPANDPARNKRSNLWVTKNIHGIDWNYGEIDYDSLLHVVSNITNSYDIIFCKGMEKATFIEKLIKHAVYDLHDFDCPSLKCLEEDTISCHYHLGKPSYVCSLNQAHRLAAWVRKHPDLVNFENEEIRRLTFGATVSRHHLLSFNGFIRGYGNELTCVYCKLKINVDNSSAKIFEFHRINSPGCLSHSL